MCCPAFPASGIIGTHVYSICSSLTSFRSIEGCATGTGDHEDREQDDDDDEAGGRRRTFVDA